MNFQILSGELKRIEALLARLNARTAPGGPASLPKFTSALGPANQTNVPVPTAAGGTVTAVQGQTGVTFSQPQTFAKGDLFIVGGSINEFAAPVANATAGTLLAPFAPVGGTGAFSTVPLASAFLKPAAMVGLPASGYTLLASGVVNVNLATAAQRAVIAYVSGSALYGPNIAEVDLITTYNGSTLPLPYDVALIVGGPAAPTTFAPALFVVDVSNGAVAADVTVSPARATMNVTRAA